MLGEGVYLHSRATKVGSVERVVSRSGDACKDEIDRAVTQAPSQIAGSHVTKRHRAVGPCPQGADEFGPVVRPDCRSQADSEEARASRADRARRIERSRGLSERVPAPARGAPGPPA